MTVAEMKARMSNREIIEWRYHLEKEPPAADRIEYMLACVCASIYNATGRMKKAAKADDFLPKWGPVRQSKDDVRMRARMWAQGLKAMQEQNAKRSEKRKIKKK